MAMPITIPRYIVDEIESWPDDGNRYEALDGVLLVTPSPEAPHQFVTTPIAVALARFVAEWPDIQVASPGVIMVRPKIELQPDFLVLRRPPGETRWEEVTEHPLAVEVQSPSTKIYDRDFKRPAYLSLGVKEVWRVTSIGSSCSFPRRAARSTRVTNVSFDGSRRALGGRSRCS